MVGQLEQIASAHIAFPIMPGMGATLFSIFIVVVASLFTLDYRRMDAFEARFQSEHSQALTQIKALSGADCI